jgi:4-amino-4-deoxy-L-arabinose transferase-like glycosyltransferase
VQWPPSRNAVVVGALLVAALAIRVVEVQSTPYTPVYDAGSYMSLASQIAHTGDYAINRRPGAGAGGARGPSAYFPPGFPYFLAAVDLIDGHTTRRDGAIHPARLSQAVLGTVIVGLIGLLAMELFGGAVALAAVALAAVYPVLVELSTVLVAENLLTALVLAAVWSVLRARRSQHPYRWVAASGILAGVAALTHENGILLVFPLAVGAWRLRPRAVVVLLGTTLVAIAPWAIRNAIVMHRLIPFSDETGITLVGTYNGASAANPLVPYKWRIYFNIPGERSRIGAPGKLTEPELSDRLQSQALDYIANHPLAPLAVAYHNTLRLLELEGSYAWHASAFAMDIQPGVAEVGVISFWFLCAMALAGVLTSAARSAPRWLWAVPLLFALSVVLVNVETPRFRAPVDPFLILLAACALTSAVRMLRRAPTEPALGRAPIGSDAGPAVPV